MLGKLLKHEFKATARWFLPLYAIALILTPITRITVSISDDWQGVLKAIPGFIIFAYVISLVVIGVCSIILLVFRFYKNMVTDEGYLTHTLPVTTNQLIWSKLITASCWSLLSILVIIASIALMFYTPGDFSDILKGIREISAELSRYSYTNRVVLIIIESFVLMFVGLLTAPLTYYAAIALGQIISKNKVLGSIVGYFIIQFASQIISTAAMVPFGILANKISYVEDITKQLSLVSNVFLPVILLFMIVSSAILFLITSFIFKKKLNLE